MANHSDTHEHGEHHVHGGPAVYSTVLIALLILTIVTVGASRIDFGAANVAIALLIATVKATLVGLWFMHLKYDKVINGMIFGATVFFLALFFAYPYIDMMSRNDIKPSNWSGPRYMPDSGAGVVGAGDKFPQAPPPKKAGEAPKPAAGH